MDGVVVGEDDAVWLVRSIGARLPVRPGHEFAPNLGRGMSTRRRVNVTRPEVGVLRSGITHRGAPYSGAMADVVLKTMNSDEGLAVLVQGSHAPLFVGVERPGGDRYICGGCGTQVLADCVSVGDLYDIAFRCFACGVCSLGPELPSGRPLPWQTTVVVDPGKYMIGSTIQGRGEAVLAGRSAVDRSLREMGLSRAVDLGPKQLSPEFFDHLLDQVRELLGDEYERLRSSHLRGLASQTPPRHPHRLMELVDAAEAAAASLRGASPSIDAVATVELNVTVAALDRWHDNPEWPTLVRSLQSPHDYRHSVITLAAASFLADAGNAVEFVPVATRPGERRPDLRVHVGARTSIRTEVKAPPVLQHPEPLSHDQAVETVRDALSSAGSGKGGQLDPDTDAVLIIGGFGLRQEDVNVLKSAGQRVLGGYKDKRRHLMAIGFLSVGVLVDGRDIGIGHTEPTLSAMLTAAVAENPNYRGSHRIGGSPSSGRLQPIRQPIRQARRQPKVGRNDPCPCGSGKKFKRCHGAV